MSEPTRRRARVTAVELALGVVLVVALVLVTPARPGGAAPGSDDPSLGPPPEPLVSVEDAEALSVRHGRSDLRLDLVSRNWDDTAAQWEVVVRATLDSRAICLPVVFDCIVAPARVDGATLTSVECAPSGWRPSALAPGRCVKPLLFAGHGQRFDLTYRTDAGSTPAALDFGVRFGRGVLPWILQPLAAADLTVAMDNAAELAMDCPTDPVGPGDPVVCTVEVRVADGPDDPPGVAAAALALDGDPVDLVGPAVLSTGDPNWTCVDAECSYAPDPAVPLEPGSAVEFAYTGVALSTQTGVEDGLLTATLDYDVQPGDDRVATARAALVVAGLDDTVLEVTKTTPVGEVVPGDELSWTITVDNVGFPGDARPLVARDVVLTDVASSGVTDLAVRPVAGVGDWTCSGSTCTTASMPEGRATFEVTGRLSPDVPPGTRVVNQVDVRWDNDVHGPDFPAVAGVAVEVVDPPVPPPAPVPAPTPSPGPAPAAPAASGAPPARLALTG